MKILKTKQAKEADEYTIKNEPISSTDLMERAATRATEWILENFAEQDEYHIFCGTGNNGGDGLVISRKLKEAGKKINVYIVEFSNKFSDDFQINYDKLKNKTKITHIKQVGDFPMLAENIVIIDAIFGSGLTRPVVGFAGEIINKINKIKGKAIISIDIPSGLFGEENHQFPEQNIIEANYTLTFEFPFISFFLAENEQYVGEVILIPIGISSEIVKKLETNFYLLEEEEIYSLIKPRKKYSHKGTYGHALLLAGSYGMTGAAVLSARAAHRTGLGLLTAHLPSACVDIMQISSPETIIDIDADKYVSTKVKGLSKYNAIAVGPAIGTGNRSSELLLKLLKNPENKAYIFDADAITILAKNKKLFDKIPPKSILTPHPKEFERLVGKSQNHYKRLMEQRKFSVRYNVIVVLKGANTTISTPDGKVFVNPTGNPGMATAGSGDVLTGIILGLLAQGYPPEKAAKIGVFIHGMAGDIAAEDIGQYSLIASDIVDYLPYALSFYDF